MARFDLNLVRTFVAIYETRSVTLAAERLELTQSTVSHALARLREAYADHLFVRDARGLQPTSLAQQLYERFSQSLAGVEDTLESRADFRPEQTTRRFRLAMSDMGMLAFGSTLLQGLDRAAPRCEVEIAQISESAFEDLVVGRTDALIGNLPALEAAMRSQLLFRDHYVCLLAQGHPGIADTLSLPRFAEARHVVISSPTPGNLLIDGALAEHRLARRIAVRVPHFLDLPHLVAGSDLLAVLPSRVARMHLRHGGLKMLPLPLAIPEFEVRLYWHARNAASPAHQWLVQALTDLLREP